MIRIGIIGCGGIANGKHMPSIKAVNMSDMVAFCDLIEERAVKAAKEYGVPGAKVYTDYRELLQDKSIAVVHVLTPNRDHSYITVDALEAGKHVVTSNKQLVAEHGTQLLALAKAHGVSFLFEASVGGGIPVLHPLSQCLGANEILEVRGILNGTTNFILTQMLEFGQSYDAALKDAQSRGYAEQNPAADVDGIDAGRKICILADMMFGKNVDPARVSMTGISTITAEDAAFAESAGMKLKLLGRAIRQGEQIAVFVSPHFVAGAQPLAPVSGVLNAIEVLGNNIGNAMFFGPGAGGPATASAVLGDVVDIVRNPGRKQPVDWSAEPADLTDPDAFEASFFLRTKLDKAACEQALGEIRWLPDQNGFHGGFTGKTCRKAIAAAGLALDAVWPVLE